MSIQNNSPITAQSYNPSVDLFGGMNNLSQGVSTQNISKDLLYDLYSNGLMPKGKGARRAVNIANAVAARMGEVFQKMMGGLMEMMQKMLGGLMGQQQQQPGIGGADQTPTPETPVTQPDVGAQPAPEQPRFPGIIGIIIPLLNQLGLGGNNSIGGQSGQVSNGQQAGASSQGGIFGNIGNMFNSLGNIFGGGGNGGFFGSIFGGFNQATNWAGSLLGKVGSFFGKIF
jgi:hypothetical protein